jgi:hypothetical protein
MKKLTLAILTLILRSSASTFTALPPLQLLRKSPRRVEFGVSQRVVSGSRFSVFGNQVAHRFRRGGSALQMAPTMAALARQ